MTKICKLWFTYKCVLCKYYVTDYTNTCDKDFQIQLLVSTFLKTVKIPTIKEGVIDAWWL